MIITKEQLASNGLYHINLFSLVIEIEECPMNSGSFDNVKNQIGFCGIWCGSCVVGNGALQTLTERYEEIVTNYGLEEWAPKDFDFKEFKKGLTSIQAISPCQGCLKGDGRPNCEMRICASDKNIADCNECDQMTACQNRETLQKMRTGALRAGLRVKTGNVDREELLQRWIGELKGKWPHRLLFSCDTKNEKG